MTKTSNVPATRATVDVALERSLEGLFRLAANRRFESRQTAVVGAVVTRAGYALLRGLADHGTCGVRQLGTASAMDPATVSRQVSALIDEGLVERTAAEGDSRAVQLSLSAHGREVYERIVGYRLAHLTNVTRDWTAEDKATLASLVERLAAGFASTPPPARTGGGTA